jgi:hypothetical protein
MWDSFSKAGESGVAGDEYWWRGVGGWYGCMVFVKRPGFDENWSGREVGAMESPGEQRLRMRLS